MSCLSLFLQYVMSARSTRVLMSAGCDVQSGGRGRAQPSVKKDKQGDPCI